MKKLLLALKYMPYIIAGIVAVERVVGDGQGATKKKVILNAITAASGVGATVDQEHVQVISKLIDLSVATLNEAGVLSSKPSPAPKKKSGKFTRPPV